MSGTKPIKLRLQVAPGCMLGNSAKRILSVRQQALRAKPRGLEGVMAARRAYAQQCTHVGVRIYGKAAI